MDRRKLRALLKWYRQECGPDFIAVLVINRDGIGFDVLTQNQERRVQETLLGNVSLLIDLILKKITREFTLGSFGVGTFDTEEYRYIFCEAGPEYVLVTVLDALASVDPYFPYAYLVAEKVSRIADGRPVSPVIPKIHVDESEKIIMRKVNTLQKIKIHASLYAYKLILGGEGGVGKTSMVNRFTSDTFESNYKATIGTAITKKECDFDGINSKVRFIIWDLAGQVQFKRVRQSYLADSEAGLIVFDLTRRETFENIKQWYAELTENAPPGIFLILIGNKNDLELSREVPKEEAEELARELGLSYFETSAKTGENVNDAFNLLAIQMIKRFVETENVEDIDTNEMFQHLEDSNNVIPDLNQFDFIEEQEEMEGLGWKKQVTMGEMWPSIEMDFIPWFQDNLELLNKALNLGLLPIDKRQNTILAKDKDASRVLIECQYGETSAETFEKIQSLVLKHDIKKVIWMCENALDTQIDSVKSINKNQMNETLYYLIQLEVFKSSNIPELNIITICKPEQKTIINIEDQEESSDNKRLSFWKALAAKLIIQFPEHATIQPDMTSSMYLSTGKDGLRYRYKISDTWASIELFFDHTNRLINNERFKQIKNMKDDIFLVSEEFEWDYDEIRNFQGIIYRINGGLNNEDKWEVIQNKMIDSMKGLVNCIKDHLQYLRL